jgi:hypothetical protein
MNKHRFELASLLALVAVFTAVFTVFANPSEACQVAAPAAVDADIPAHRADYNLAGRAVDCSQDVVSAAPVFVPVTGVLQSPYARFKELQAELMSGGQIQSAAPVHMSYFEFKELQAELMSAGPIQSRAHMSYKDFKELQAEQRSYGN